LETLSSSGHVVLRTTLRNVRENAKLSQEGLAKRLQEPQSYVSKIERGERKIDPVEMFAWAEACDTDPWYLFGLFVIGMIRRPRLSHSSR
jgi:transcriptional regulator with XRE-family HTH domain